MEQEGGPLWLRRALEGVMAKPSVPLESWPGVEVRQVPVADGVARVLHARPAQPVGCRPVVFIPGFGATIGGWQEAYDVLLGEDELYVIETLEKSTTTLSHPTPDLSVRGLALQVSQALAALELPEVRAAVKSASMPG